MKLIVAVDQNWGIGKNNDLSLIHILLSGVVSFLRSC